MNYRHAFHAGNFADLVKHASVLALLDALQADARPLRVVDTHAGAGRYDLTDEKQARSGEAEAGIKRLTSGDVPEPLAALAVAVAAKNPKGGVRTYPGSPELIADRLREGDAYVGCELRDDDHAALMALIGTRGRALKTDGYAAAVDQAKRSAPDEKLFVLIDPPFERADDYVNVVRCLRDVLAAKPEAVCAVWLPLKDLETLDSFVRRWEAEPPAPLTIVEARLRPLTDPMKMNGCVLALVNVPEADQARVQAIAGAVVAALGAPGGLAKRWTAG